MRRVFADTVFWIAILDPGDGLHRAATSALEEVAGAQLVTSEMVLVETLNAFSVAGTQMRSAAVRMVEKLRARPNLVIVPQTPGLFEAAFQIIRRLRIDPTAKSGITIYIHRIVLRRSS
jgi:predicted nucleic acid-binding protein